MGEAYSTLGDGELAALERFVVENDELLELEERIGRFNIFDALGVARKEIRHSNFLAWLLDPNESHGQGALFLNAVLMDLLKEAPPEMRPLSPVELDGEELRGVEVRREWKNIDLLITCKEPPFVFAVENKIDSGESKGQLKRYKTLVHEHFSELKPMFVFLTTDGVEPSDDDWVPYSYADIHRVLERVRRTGAGAIGDDVEAFLEHYLRLIGSRFMDDPKIDELCQRIYKNHRQAIDLIVDRVVAGRNPFLVAVDEVVSQQSDRWLVFRRTTREVEFIPVPWLDVLPPIRFHPRHDGREWLFVTLRCYRGRCHSIVCCHRVTDESLRERSVERLLSTKEFGLKRRRKALGRAWNSLGRTNIARWDEGTEPEVDDLKEKIRTHLDALWDQLARVPDALRPIIEEWEASR